MTTTTDNTTTSVDRICDYIASKVPSSTWDFHGASIRSFVEKEVWASSPDIKTCEQSMLDYNHGKWVDLETLIAQGKSITNADFHDRAKVTPAAMRRYVFSLDQSQATGTEARVCQDIATRQQLGLAKYGVTVESNPLSRRQWAQHAYEECLDMAIYLRRLIEEMDKQEYAR